MYRSRTSAFMLWKLPFLGYCIDHWHIIFRLSCSYLKCYVFAQELVTTKEKCYNSTLLPNASKTCSSPQELLFLNKPWKKSATSLDYRVQNAPSISYLKLLLMSGIFTLQPTQQAFAGSDIASSLQSFSFLGGLGDISTGFASVRKFSL